MPFMVFAAIGANVTTVFGKLASTLTEKLNDNCDRTQSCMKQ